MINILEENSFTIDEKRKYFIGVITYTILDKNLFSRNNQLKEYLKIIEEFDGMDVYKEYLYKSRTLLVARVGKDIRNSLSDNQFKKLILKHEEFMSNLNTPKEQSIESKKEKRKSNQNSILSNYLKSLKGDTNDN